MSDSRQTEVASVVDAPRPDPATCEEAGILHYARPGTVRFDGLARHRRENASSALVCGSIAMLSAIGAALSPASGAWVVFVLFNVVTTAIAILAGAVIALWAASCADRQTAKLGLIAVSLGVAAVALVAITFPRL